MSVGGRLAEDWLIMARAGGAHRARARAPVAAPALLHRGCRRLQEARLGGRVPGLDGQRSARRGDHRVEGATLLDLRVRRVGSGAAGASPQPRAASGPPFRTPSPPAAGFDLGRVAPEQEGLLEFKRRWGGQALPLAYDYWPEPGGLNLAARDRGSMAAWRRSGPACRLGSPGWARASTATWDELVSFAWRLRKKILKRWARNAFFPRLAGGIAAALRLHGSERCVYRGRPPHRGGAGGPGQTSPSAIGSASLPGSPWSPHPTPTTRASGDSLRSPRAHRHRGRCLARRRVRHPARCAHWSAVQSSGPTVSWRSDVLPLHVVAGQPARTVRRAYSRSGVAMILLDRSAATLRPAERYGLDVLLDLSRCSSPNRPTAIWSGSQWSSVTSAGQPRPT